MATHGTAPRPASTTTWEWVRSLLADFEPVPAFGKSEPDPEALARHANVVTRVHKAWPALRNRVVSEIDQIDDESARARIWAALLALLKYKGTNSYFVERRELRREANSLAQSIREKAGELAALLHKRTDLIESQGLGIDAPNLFDCLDCWFADAERNPEYAAWAMVARSRFNEFLIIARTQSRPCPDLAELMEVLAQLTMPDAHQPQSRKSTSDLRRALLSVLDASNLIALGAPPDFRLTDAAVADLLTSLFAHETSDDDVRKLRRSLE